MSAILLACAACVLAVEASTALADSATLTVTNTAGQSDPAAGLPRVFTVSGVAAVPERLYVLSRATGGAPCAPTADSDTGSSIDNDNDEFFDVQVNGSFSISEAITWASPGPELFCIWLAASSSTVTTPISQAITFRSPTGTISASISPATPEPGQTATAIVTGSSEAPENVFATIDAAGATCAPTFASDNGNELIDSDQVNGTFSVSQTFSEQSAGQYELCLWLADSESDTSPIAGPQAAPFTVAAPPPPCVVPSLSKSRVLSSVESALQAGHCAVGAITSVESRTVAQGKVVGLSPKAGSTLANGAPVGIDVSEGPPCRVPVLVRGEPVGLVEKALRVSNCAVGPVVKEPSNVRRGRVVRLSPASGTQAPPHTAVTVVVSKGRH